LYRVLISIAATTGYPGGRRVLCDKADLNRDAVNGDFLYEELTGYVAK
jgi:hypothetical protein